jgi:hypothetical protein
MSRIVDLDWIAIGQLPELISHRSVFAQVWQRVPETSRHRRAFCRLITWGLRSKTSWRAR